MKIESITVEGVEYPVSKFSAEIQALVNLHNVWKVELEAEKTAYIKTEAALRGVLAELTTEVQKAIAEMTPATESEQADTAAV